MIIDGTDITLCSAWANLRSGSCSGVLFQDGALFGSMSFV